MNPLVSGFFNQNFIHLIRTIHRSNILLNPPIDLSVNATFLIRVAAVYPHPPVWQAGKPHGQDTSLISRGNLESSAEQMCLRRMEAKIWVKQSLLKATVALAATTWRQSVHNLWEVTHWSNAGRVHSGLQPGACMLFLIPGTASAHAHAPQPLLTLHMQRNPITRGAHYSAGPAQLSSRRCLRLLLFWMHALARAGDWLVIYVSRSFTHLPSVVFKTRDAGVALGGNNNRARCCPASITQPSGPCRLTSPGEYSPPVLPRKSPRAAEMDEDAQQQPQQQQPDRGERSVAGLLPGLQGAEASALQLRIKNSIWWGGVQRPVLL